MGNTISTRNGELIESQLRQHIINWAKNDYTEGLGTSAKYKNILIKRACCTGVNELSIALPDINSTDNYSTVIIPIFDNTNPMTPEKCTFQNDFSKKYYYTDKSGFVISNGNCASLYNDLCANVRNEHMDLVDAIEKIDRKYNADDDRLPSRIPEDLYGFYADKDMTPTNMSKQYKVNAYVDCNCENSVFKQADITISTNQQKPNQDMNAQMFDMRCNSNFSRTFKTNDARVQNACFNSIAIDGHIDISDSSVANIGNSCNMDIKNITIEQTTPNIISTSAIPPIDIIEPSIPTSAPTSAPTNMPTSAPTNMPTKIPTSAPTSAPTKNPTSAPTSAPTSMPTNMPTNMPIGASTSADATNIIGVSIGGFILIIIIIVVYIKYKKPS